MADINASQSVGINLAPAQTTESVNSTVVDDTKDKSISSGIGSTANTDIKTNVSSSSTINPESTQTAKGSVTSTINNVEVKYSIKDLTENSKALTGHKREVAVGALFNCKENELTKKEFKDLVDKFLKRKVK